MVDQAEDLAPQTSIGQYDIHRRIGSGGMGDVYAAEHMALGKRVAIKVLRRRYVDDETVVARFIREGKLAARLRHPNIVDVTDVAVIDGVPCLVMELLEGEPLADKIEREGSVAASDLVDVMLPIVAALDHAHGEGVLHRDLKPANVFLARSWNGELVPKLLDFGISKSVGESAASAALTNDSGFLGTPRYAPPEILRGDKASPRSDQYAFGLVLYEAATGTKPFAEVGGSIVALARAIACGDTKKPRELNAEIPEAFERVVRRAMALRVEDRYPSMRSLGAALLPLASDRVRTIWSPVFATAEPLEVTGVTDAFELDAPSSGAKPGAAMDPEDDPGPDPSREDAPLYTDPPEEPGTLVISPRPAEPISAAGQNETVVLARPPVVVPSTAELGATTVRSLSVPGGQQEASSSFGSTLTSILTSVAASPLSPFILGGLALTGVVLITIAVVARGSKASSGPEPVAAAPVVQTRFTIAVRAVPPTASFDIDGAPAGVGTLARAFPRDGKEHVLLVSAAGYVPLEIRFDETSPPPKHIALQPLETRPEEPATEPPQAGAVEPAVTGVKSVHPRPPASAPRKKTDNIDPWK